MRIIGLPRGIFGCARISFTTAVLLAGMATLTGSAGAREPEKSPKPAATADSPAMAAHSGAQTSLVA